MKPTFISWKDKRFGRASLWAALFIHAFAVCLLIWGDHWIAYLCAVVLPGVLWVASLIDWRNFLKIDHKHPNAHRVDICEGCDPICYADDGRPLSYWDWLSSVHRIEVPAYYQLDSERTYELASAYQAYKAHPKFKNYKP
jgi:hypothetical protein